MRLHLSPVRLTSCRLRVASVNMVSGDCYCVRAIKLYIYPTVYTFYQSTLSPEDDAKTTGSTGPTEGFI